VWQQLIADNNEIHGEFIISRWFTSVDYDIW